MPDSKVEVKACPWCQQQPIKRTDSYIPDAVACPNGHTAPMRLSEWNNRPIANNGVSLDYIKKVVDDSTSNILDDCCLDKISSVIHAKLQPTAPRGDKPLAILKRIIKSTPHSMCSDAEAWAIAEKLITEGEVIGG